MKIAVLVKSFVVTGGMERYAVEVARRLKQKGHEIHLYARAADPAWTEGIIHHVVPNKRRYSSVANSLSFARECYKLLQGENYDVIHSHERGYCQDLLTLHTFSYKGSTQRFSRIKRIDRVYLSPRSLLYLWLERRQMQTPFLVSVSEAVQKDCETCYVKVNHTAVITPGVDTEWFSPGAIGRMRNEVREAESIRPDDMVVLFVGSEFKRKGLDDLIPAIGAGMKLWVVGAGERRGHYLGLVERHGLERQVRFAGHSKDVRRFYAMADVVVLPSISEAFGMVALEGMACGLPVIVRAGTGAAPLVRQRENGYVFKDPGELASLLNELSGALEERLDVGRRARRTAMDHTWDHTAEMYESLLSRIAEKKRSESQHQPWSMGF